MEAVNWPITSGCTSVGGGCESCPARWQARREGRSYHIRMHDEHLGDPPARTAPTYYTVALGSDLFHEGVSDAFITQVFAVMNTQPHHTFEVVTKRAERLELLADTVAWTPNIRIGVTVESHAAAWRIKPLQGVPSAQRFLSCVPLLGPVGRVDLSGIQCVGAGPEHWGLRRPCEQAWLDDLFVQCRQQGVRWSSVAHVYREGWPAPSTDHFEEETTPCQEQQRLH